MEINNSTSACNKTKVDFVRLNIIEKGYENRDHGDILRNVQCARRGKGKSRKPPDGGGE